ncbi:helix-turn-helix transcriptional regulator [Novosphingobium sp. PY1]|uniref:helix-turn-helix transcriptional regulator n=1 Tax=Novosphingobium sp. PY1 TaxID=1882221 RepID=UPI001A8E228A|nr:helix-turn-helix transcriptional regulator [Novosphingobium sp. PY1]GFM28809.1 LuxR family transcriptional regulator [Novosphingobium sp. PY1]
MKDEALALSNLLAALYGGIDDERPWQAFLKALAEWMEATYATLIITTPGNEMPATFITPGADPQRSEDYIRTYFAQDPFRGLPEGEVMTYRGFLAGLPEETYETFSGYMREAHSAQVIGVDLRFPRGFEARFRVTRIETEPEFRPDDIAKMQGLVPHLRLAIALFEKLQFAGAQHGAFHSAAQGMGIGLVVLDRDRHVVSRNPLAEQLLDEGEGVHLSGQWLTFDNAADARRIDTMLTENYSDGPTRFRIERPVNGDLMATARPIDVPAVGSGSGALALLLSQPGHEELPSPQVLRELFGLTPAEARLASTIAGGESLVNAAHSLGIAHNTAKVQLRSVFAKTGVRRQAQLVTLIAHLSG